jgi:hypothetical protein
MARTCPECTSQFEGDGIGVNAYDETLPAAAQLIQDKLVCSDECAHTLAKKYWSQHLSTGIGPAPACGPVRG